MLRLRNFALVIGVAALIIYAMVVGRTILLPLVGAVVVWYLINVLAMGFARLSFGRLPGPLCRALAAITFLVVTWVMVNMIGSNLAQIVNGLPVYEARLNALIASIYADLDLGEAPTFGQLVGSVDVRAMATATAAALANMAGALGLVFVYVLFLLKEEGGFDRKLSALFKDKNRETEVRRILLRMSTDIQTYLRIKVLLSLLVGIFGYVVLWALEVDFAPFWASLMFLFNFIPTIGTPMSLIGPAIFAVLQFDSFTPLIIIALGIGMVQVVVSNFIEPSLMGRSLNLSPFVIILALVLFGTLWGLVGMVLCVPILVMVMIVLSNFPKTRGLAVLLSADGQVNQES